MNRLAALAAALRFPGGELPTWAKVLVAIMATPMLVAPLVVFVRGAWGLEPTETLLAGTGLFLVTGLLLFSFLRTHKEKNDDGSHPFVERRDANQLDTPGSSGEAGPRYGEPDV